MKPSILTIDDSPEIHDLIDVRLAPEGVTLLHATDGDEGFEMAASHMPDLVLLDIVMPGSSGFEICQRLKSDPATASIPIIFLTGATDSFNMVRGLDLGAVDYITKPFDPTELRARVRAALRTKRYQDMLAQRAQIDAVTGLWNRSCFDDRLKDELSVFTRYGRTISLAMIDLDDFKSVNDMYGHPFGDRVLQSVGEAIHARVRSTDFACRYGGDEFTVIFTETGLQEALEATERIRAGLEALRWDADKADVRLCASFGVASTEQFDPEATVFNSEFVSAADVAQYRAKQQGGNCVMAKISSDNDPQRVEDEISPALSPTQKT